MVDRSTRKRLLRLAPGSLQRVLRRGYTSMRRAQFRLKYGFVPPPEGTDLVGYETLIDCLDGLLDLPGDVVEIGAFCGGGTYTVASFLARRSFQKTVYVIDCFNTEFDKTECTAGVQMAQLYAGILNGRSQREVFRRVTGGLKNIVVIEDDSKLVRLPTELVCFAFVDGNHSPEYVRNDFELVWRKLVPEGVVAFHDYGHDLPQVTSALDDLCLLHKGEIFRLRVDSAKHILFITKRRGQAGK